MSPAADYARSGVQKKGRINRNVADGRQKKRRSCVVFLDPMENLPYTTREEVGVRLGGARPRGCSWLALEALRREASRRRGEAPVATP
jgi:hypothetical protein